MFGPLLDVLREAMVEVVQRRVQVRALGVNGVVLERGGAGGVKAPTVLQAVS
jgi:hypothetical protein